MFKLRSFLLLLCFFNSCSFFKDPIVLQINSHTWTRTKFAKLLALKAKSIPFPEIQNPNWTERIKNQLVTDLVTEYIINRWAEANKIFISNQELETHLNKYNKDTGVFKLYLKRKKRKKENWQKNIHRRVLHQKVLNKIGENISKPSQEEIKTYYQHHQNLFKKPQQILIYHFFDKKKHQLIRLKEKLKATSSIKNLKVKPIWVEKGIFPIFDKAFDVKQWEFSSILSSAHGYHIIQVLDKKKAYFIPFEKAKNRIEKTLLQQRKKAYFLKWLDQESKTLQILKNKEILKNMRLRKL